LSIPENYYDDLEARIDLQPGALDRLRANNVLYDRQGSGEYFQIYTKSFDGGFFFELVERRAYGGFGAANAPIRLAAQTRLVRDPLSWGVECDESLNPRQQLPSSPRKRRQLVGVHKGGIRCPFQSLLCFA